MRMPGAPLRHCTRRGDVMMSPQVPDPASSERVYARYWIETAWPVDQAAEIMAGEQSTGTFVRVPGETDELREGHAARIEAVQELDCVSAPSLPGAGLPQGVDATPV